MSGWIRRDCPRMPKPSKERTDMSNITRRYTAVIETRNAHLRYISGVGSDSWLIKSEAKDTEISLNLRSVVYSKRQGKEILMEIGLSDSRSAQPLSRRESLSQYCFMLSQRATYDSFDVLASKLQWIYRNASKLLVIWAKSFFLEPANLYNGAASVYSSLRSNVKSSRLMSNRMSPRHLHNQG